MIRLSLSTSLSEKFIFYFCGLIKNNIHIEYIFIQTNIYRSKRELKKLKKRGLKYFPRFLLNYLTYKIFGLRCSIPNYIYYKIRKLFVSVNIDDFESFLTTDFFKNNSLQSNNFYINLDKLKLFNREYCPKTSIILINNINSDIDNPVINKSYDYLLLIGGAIIKDEIIKKINIPILCLHNSMLPLLRGWGGGEIWALIKNIPQAIGQTIFFILKGIDDGEILFQKKILILKEDELSSIIERNIENGLEVILEALKMLDKGKYKTIKQDETKVIKINGRPNAEQQKIGLENLKNIIQKL